MTSSDRPWTAFYGPDMRTDIGTASYRTICDLIRSASDTYGQATAFTVCMPNGMNGSLTYKEVDEMSDAFAVYLREVAGLTKGDRVALQMPNGLAFPVAAFGILKAGCVLVNVNPLYTAEEMAKQFQDAEPHALVIIDMFADKIPQATRGHPIPNIIITRVAEFMPFIPRTLIGLVQKYKDKTVKPIEVPHTHFQDALKAGRAHRSAQTIEVGKYHQDVGPSDIACLQYTGGTTGVAKGAMLTHENLVMNMEQSLEMIPAITKGDEVILTALPMYHIFAFTLNLLAFYWLGSHNILVPSPRPIVNLKPAFEKYKITWLSGVNTLFNALNNEQWFRDNPPKSLKMASAGGMALQTEVARRWEEITGKPVLQGYGLTETSPVLSFNPFGKTRDGSIGVPIPSTLMRCVDDDGNTVPAGERGEIAAKGPQVMPGYWNKPEETAKVMRDGWFLTGDIGVMDEDGYFYVVDRKKDMILVSGFNVYPNEVEDCLASHPAIFEAAVIGVPDGAAGEAVKAFVIVADGSLTQEEVRAYCKQHLTAYKVPKYVEFREDLPKSNVGKILRKDLRADEMSRTASS